MKSLFLVRHAKTVKAAFGEDDHGRALLPQGEQEALNLGQDLAKNSRIPQVLLVSDSLRTRQTALLVQEALCACQACERPVPIEFLPELYQGGVETMLSLLAGRSENCIMVIGHNPGIEEAVESLAGEYEHMRPGSYFFGIWDINAWEELFAHPLPVETHLFRPKSS